LSDPRPGTGRLGWPVAAALTFLAAGCVLVLEIAAGRLMAPYVGVSLTTYTGIIAAILAGIALGAWIGGRAADAFGPLPLLGPAFVLGGVAATASVPIVGAVGTLGLGDGFVAIVTLATVAFVAPAAILSAVGPMIVRATLTDLATSGSIVGRLSAIGTVGAITGTLLTGFVLLGLFPTRVLIVAVGALLVVIGLALTAVLRRRGASLTGILALAAVGMGGVALTGPSPCDTESAYYCIAVVDEFNDPDGRTLVLDRLTHAHVELDDPTDIQFGYVRRFADAVAPYLDRLGRPADVLHVGGGGFTFPRYLAATRPIASQTVLELDPRVLEVARTRLGFAPTDAIEVVLGDARRSIERLPDDGFDLVVGDAFGGLAVPWHLTTAEFLADVERVLRPGGMYVMNLIDYPPLGFVRAEAATASRSFEHLAVIAGRTTLDGQSGGNVVLVASDEGLDVAAVSARIDTWHEAAETMILADPAEVAAFVGDATILTDDFAPVDQLLGR
jgi:predicted membrane-bound spermidine synthase